MEVFNSIAKKKEFNLNESGSDHGENQDEKKETTNYQR